MVARLPYPRSVSRNNQMSHIGKLGIDIPKELTITITQYAVLDTTRPTRGARLQVFGGPSAQTMRSDHTLGQSVKPPCPGSAAENQELPSLLSFRGSVAELNTNPTRQQNTSKAQSSTLQGLGSQANAGPVALNPSGLRVASTLYPAEGPLSPVVTTGVRSTLRRSPIDPIGPRSSLDPIRSPSIQLDRGSKASRIALDPMGSPSIHPQFFRIEDQSDRPQLLRIEGRVSSVECRGPSAGAFGVGLK